MSHEREFPVMWPHDRAARRRLEKLGCPRSVPWHLVASHAENARRNHDQSVERLAERGGLSPSELVAVLRGEPLSAVLARTDERATELLIDFLQRTL